MEIEAIQKFCLSLPHVSSQIQWGDNLVFKVGEKIFAILALDPTAKTFLSFKCDPEIYEVLLEEEQIVPAPYLARYLWVALESLSAIDETRVKSLLKTSYDLVFSKLPKKKQDALL